MVGDKLPSATSSLANRRYNAEICLLDGLYEFHHDTFAQLSKQDLDALVKYYLLGQEVPENIFRWGTSTSNANTAAAAARGNKIVLSPANKAYLDQKYDANTPLGLRWAGYIEVADAYGWNPGSYLTGVGESSVLGVEAPLWSETLTRMSDIEYMAFPRLPAIAELGWSPESTHDWNTFRSRLGAQGPRWSALGIHYYPSPQVPWT